MGQALSSSDLDDDTDVPADMSPEVRQLHIAVMRNDVEELRKLIFEGVDVNSPWFRGGFHASIKNGITPLCAAVSLNHLVIVEELLKYGALVNKANSCGSTPLHKAAFHGRSDIAELLIKAGADVNRQDNDSDTPLHVCVQAGISSQSIATLKALINAGSDVNQKNESGQIPLHYAAARGMGDWIKVLVEAKSDVNCMDNERKTPMYLYVTDPNFQADLSCVLTQLLEANLSGLKTLIMSGCDTLNLASFVCKNKSMKDHFNADIELSTWLKARQPESLKELCRLSIIKHMQIENYNFDVTEEVRQLSLPDSLCSYLSRKQL